MANKITYGLSNVVVWPIVSTSAAGVPSYGTKIPVPGAVDLSLDAEGSSDPFYADDQVYYQGVANNGYSGSLTIADIPTAFSTNVMGETVDANGAVIEKADVEPKEFAVAFEFKGDEKKRRHLFYRCKATRPSVASSTKEDSVAPNTPELSLAAMPRLDDGTVKARCEEGDAAYDSWYGVAPYASTAYEPTYKYTAVSPAGTENPSTEGWYERTGTDPDYVYTLSDDTTVDSGTTYYIRTIVES